MFKIMPLPNMEGFHDLISRCQGDVLLHLPDGASCSLKKDTVAIQLLQIASHEKSWLNLQLTNQQDFPLFLNYMMAAAPSKKR